MKRKFYISHSVMVSTFIILAFSFYSCAHKIYYFEKPGEANLEAGHRTVKSRNNKRYLFVELGDNGTAIACIEAPPFLSDRREIKLAYKDIAKGSYSSYLQQGAISEILKVGYYNLCQAKANGYIDDKEYHRRLGDLIEASRVYVILAGVTASGGILRLKHQDTNSSLNQSTEIR